MALTRPRESLSSSAQAQNEELSQDSERLCETSAQRSFGFDFQDPGPEIVDLGDRSGSLPPNNTREKGGGVKPAAFLVGLGEGRGRLDPKIE